MAKDDKDDNKPSRRPRAAVLGEETAKSARDATSLSTETGSAMAQNAQDSTRRITDTAIGGAADMARLGGDAANQGFDQMRDLGQEQASQAFAFGEASSRGYRDMLDLSSNGVQSFVQSGSQVARDLQELSNHVMSMTQASMQAGMRAATGAMQCRSWEDLMRVQQDFMQESMETLMSEGAELMRLSGAIAQHSISPLQEQMHDGTLEAVSRRIEQLGGQALPRIGQYGRGGAADRDHAGG